MYPSTRFPTIDTQVRTPRVLKVADFSQLMQGPRVTVRKSIMFTCTYWHAVIWSELAENWDLRIFDKFDSLNLLNSNRFGEHQPVYLRVMDR